MFTMIFESRPTNLSFLIFFYLSLFIFHHTSRTTQMGFSNFNTMVPWNTTMNLLQGQSLWSHLGLSALLAGTMTMALSSLHTGFKPATFRIHSPLHHITHYTWQSFSHSVTAVMWWHHPVLVQHIYICVAHKCHKTLSNSSIMTEEADCLPECLLAH